MNLFKSIFFIAILSLMTLSCRDDDDTAKSQEELALKELENSAREDLTVHRIIEDGNFIVTHSSYMENDEAKVSFDIFTFSNGVITNQETGTQAFEGPNPSGRTMVDGPTEITELEKTEANKATVGTCYEEVLLNNDESFIPICYEGNNYLQHNPNVPDGLDSLLGFLEDLANNGSAIEFTGINNVIGEGNFVLVHASANFAGTPINLYDLFRVEDDKLAEHWDVIE